MAPCVSGSIQVHDLRNTHAIYCVSATLAQQVSCIFFSISIFIWLLNPTDSSQIGAKRKRKATPFSNYFTGNVDTNVKGKCFVNECHDLCVYSHEYNQNTCVCVCVCVCLNLLINASSPLSEQYAGLGFNVKIHIKYFNKQSMFLQSVIVRQHIQVKNSVEMVLHRPSNQCPANSPTKREKLIGVRVSL